MYTNTYNNAKEVKPNVEFRFRILRHPYYTQLLLQYRRIKYYGYNVLLMLTYLINVIVIVPFNYAYSFSALALVHFFFAFLHCNINSYWTWCSIITSMVTKLVDQFWCVGVLNLNVRNEEQRKGRKKEYNKTSTIRQISLLLRWRGRGGSVVRFYFF